MKISIYYFVNIYCIYSLAHIEPYNISIEGCGMKLINVFLFIQLGTEKNICNYYKYIKLT